MQIGKYQIGRYHAIIEKTYTDGSVEYETNFTTYQSLDQRVVAMKTCIGQTMNDNRILSDIRVICGRENIIRTLSGPEAFL